MQRHQGTEPTRPILPVQLSPGSCVKLLGDLRLSSSRQACKVDPGLGCVRLKGLNSLQGRLSDLAFWSCRLPWHRQFLLALSRQAGAISGLPQESRAVHGRLPWAASRLDGARGPVLYLTTLSSEASKKPKLAAQPGASSTVACRSSLKLCSLPMMS